MGQYYRQALQQDGEIRYFNTQYCSQGDNNYNNYRDYNGLKLTEHSWIGNEFMDAMTNQLYNHKGRLVWCGDYADEQGDFKNVQWTDYKKIYPKGEVDFPPLKMEGKFDYTHKFLVNHTHKCYLDFDLYMSKCKDKDGWIIHPLSLLTAIGNGRGSGDYDDKYPDSYVVGMWAGDLLEVTDEAPAGYELEDIRFIEDRGYDDDRM